MKGLTRKASGRKFLVNTYFEQKRQPLEVRSQGLDRLTTLEFNRNAEDGPIQLIL